MTEKECVCVYFIHDYMHNRLNYKCNEKHDLLNNH